MDQRLSKQCALVTGANSGIGEGVVRALAAAGANVVLNYVSHGEQAERIAASIREQGGEVVTCQGNIANPTDCRTIFDAADGSFGGVDIVVASAGIQRDAAAGDMTLEQWREVIDVNLTGQFLCAQEAVKRFRSHGLRGDRSQALGKIIFMSSVHQEIPWAGHVNYAAAKGGIKLLMESMAQELAPEKIRVNAVAPGAIKTPINRTAWETKEAAEKLKTLIPYGRIGEPSDVANAVSWLVSDEADYITGTTLMVDGGMTLYPAFRAAG